MKQMRLTNALAILGFCLAFGIVPAQAQMGLADAKRGQELSQRLCSGCHSVSPGSAATVNADVPTFAAIASRPDATAERLAGRIIVPHPPMPSGGDAGYYRLHSKPADAALTYYPREGGGECERRGAGPS